MNAVYASSMSAPDVSTASTGPPRSIETYARLLASSSSRSNTTLRVTFTTESPPSSTSPYNSPIVPATL